MAVNPLIVFVGLSVVTLGGLVVVTQQGNNPFSKDAAKTAVASQTEQPAPPAPDLSDKKAPVKKMASLPPAQTAETQKTETKTPASKPVTKTPASKPVTKAPAAKPSPVIAPTFDVVRIEGDGGTVIVGRAAPGSEVSLKLNGKVIGQSATNEKGDWVFIPDQLVPQGNHELIVEATGKNGEVVRSAQTIFIAMPKNSDEKPLVVVSKPDAPTRVLQKPEAVAEAKPQVKTATNPEAAPVVTAQPDKKAPAETVTEKTVVATAEPAPKPASPEKKAVEKPAVEKTASLPAAVSQQITENQQPAAKAVTPQATPAPTVEKKAEPQKVDTTPLTFGTVDYNDQGDIVFSGTASAGKTIRLYVDNQFVGDTLAGEKGNWVFHGREQIKPGTHELRADQVDGTGRVSQRTAVPFVRANPSEVAAFLKTKPKNTLLTPPVSTATPPTPPVVVASKPVEKTPDVKQPVAPVSKKAEDNQETTKTETPSQPTAPVMAAKDPTPESEITTTETPPAKKPEMVSHVVIQPGNNLWNISRVIYGKGIAYTTIYQANRKQVKNPHRIYPGQILTTPGVKSSGSIEPDRREPLASVSQNSGADSN